LYVQSKEFGTQVTDVEPSARQNTKMAKYSLTRRISVFTAALFLSVASVAEQTSYAPADLYEYETFVLENGLRVFLNNRGKSPNAVMRLVVGTGMNDYPCDKRELPHLVEHLMFSGFGELNETDLDSFITEWGASWNAYTYSYRTTYDLKIYSRFLDKVTILLTTMFEETQITQDELEAARTIVHAEAGGVAGTIRKYFYKNGIFEGDVERAYRRYAPGSHEWCETPIDANSIDLSDVEHFMETQHNPSNMTLIVVGNFDIEAFKEVLDYTFAALEERAGSEESRNMAPVQFIETDYHTRTGALVGQEGYACLEFGVPEWTAPERATIVLISEYLETTLFEELRTNLGLSYDPSVGISDFGQFSTLMLDASTATENLDEAMGVMETLVEDIRTEGIPENELDHLRQSKLYRIAAAYESNYSVADFYERNLLRWQLDGAFPDLDSFYADVTTEDTIAVAQKYLIPERALRYTSRPTFSYSGFAGLAAVPLLGIVAFRVRRRKKNNHQL
jgi:predicted Zn-dependent peptidase